MLKQVVLPAPFGPIKAWIEPRRTLRLTSLTAEKPPNSLLNPSVTRMCSSLIPPARPRASNPPNPIVFLHLSRGPIWASRLFYLSISSCASGFAQTAQASKRRSLHDAEQRRFPFAPIVRPLRPAGGCAGGAPNRALD